MRLTELLRLAAIPHAELDADPEARSVVYDSRRAGPGSVFVAVAGFHVDGARFVADAFRRGAAAAVVSRQARPDSAAAAASMPTIGVDDPRAALASLAAAFYNFPARNLRTIGITGTDGKTSTSYLISALLDAAGFSCGLFTTVAFKAGGVWENNEARQTTPEAVEVQALLRRMVDARDQYAVLESTSHGLELHKLDHCEYDVAVFTNLSPDHLDFHGTVGRYRAAKGRLFAMLDTALAKGAEKLAVLNSDDPASAYMAAQAAARRLTYAIDASADVRPLAMDLRADGTDLRIASPYGELSFRLPLPGRFNVYNALAATSVALSQGVSPTTVSEALASARGVPGRMQRVESGQPFTIIVDYAHTGASFAKVLETLRPLTPGRLIAVFGCAGERGTERRSGMGSVAARLADYTVITTEDPRGEDPEAIIDQIAAAMQAAGAEERRDFERVPDRREAIGRAFDLARPGDTVLLAGKGHEHSIETAAGPVPWDEAGIAAELLRARFGGGSQE